MKKNDCATGTVSQRLLPSKFAHSYETRCAVLKEIVPSAINNCVNARLWNLDLDFYLFFVTSLCTI